MTFVIAYQILVDKALDFSAKGSSPFPARFNLCVQGDEHASLEIVAGTLLGFFPNLPFGEPLRLDDLLTQPSTQR